MILVSKFMVHRDLSDKTYLSLGLLSPLKHPALHLLMLSNNKNKTKSSVPVQNIVIGKGNAVPLGRCGPLQVKNIVTKLKKKKRFPHLFFT